MRFSLIPRETKFFDMLDECVGLLTGASGKLVDLVTVFDKVKERSEELLKDEHACDLVVARIITALDQTFITPFDREDIHSLAVKLDDVMDNLEETAYRFWSLRIEQPTPVAVELAGIIRESCGHVAAAVRLLRDMKDIAGIQQHLLEIGRLENEADRIYREADSALFVAPADVLMLIKLRELYDWLEETVDACRAVADIVSEIVIKGS